MTTTVINRHRHDTTGSVSIQRHTRWGNPHKLASRADLDVAACLLGYVIHLTKSGLIDEVKELRGRALLCSCAPARCHGDILARVADAEDARAELAIIRAELCDEIAAIPEQGALL